MNKQQQQLSQWRAKNKEHIKEYNKSYWAKWYAKNKEKRSIDKTTGFGKIQTQARHAVETAIKNGKLVKENCAVTDCNIKGEAHHPDYSKPLEVLWLCPSHHRKLHRSK